MVRVRTQARSVQLTAPVGGWDTRQALADMPVENAIILDNWFPTTDKVTMRRGHTSHATGMSGEVQTLMTYTPNTGTDKLFAANNLAIYDVSSAGAVGAAVVSSLGSNKWQWTQMGTAGGQFLLLFNGTDTPRTYDGTTWANSTISGPTIADLIWCNIYQNRLWVGEKDTLDTWYLAVDSIGGAATKLALGGVAKRGGYVMAMGTWTRDAGDGSDDVAVFLTSEGEALIYQGAYPGATDWALVGVFSIGKPIGRRCIIKAGADLVMVTQDGFVTAGAILSLDRSQTDKASLSAQINRAVNDAVRDYGAVFGWQPFLYPKGIQLIFNVPQNGSLVHQFVFNTITGAPCRFTGMNALCWALKEDDAFFGGYDGVVYKADDGAADNLADINGDALQAFSNFRSSGTVKAFRRAEPIFESNGSPDAALDLNVDYQIKAPTGISGGSQSTAPTWGVGKWGRDKWGTDGQVFRGWQAVTGVGRSASLRVRVDSQTVRPSWIATNFLYIPGGQL